MEEALLKPRHSLSHILAQAIQRSVDPSAKLGIGPAIDTGFYYDFIFSDGVEFKEEHLKDLNKMMVKIVKESQLFHRIDLNYKQAKEIITMLGEEFKIELIEEFKKEGETVFSYYINTIPMSAKENLLKGSKPEYFKKYEKINEYISKIENGKLKIENSFITFIDMCEGPHVENTKEINPDAFKLDKIAGAYWRGSEKNPMMTRIYGLAFEDKNALKAYIEMMEEAKKRDHRVLGKKMGLFTFSEKVGLGLPLWMPKGAMLYNVIEDFRKKEHEKNGYQFVKTPHIGNRKLRETSGHRGFYSESMYPPMEVGQSLEDAKSGKKAEESEQYLMKPMNCPFHVEIYKAAPKSYRDFPLRRCEMGTVYRFEKKGQLSGLVRVRGFTQDDAHIICRRDQVEGELKRVVNFILFIYKSFGFKKEDVRVYLSLRDPNNKTKYAGNDAGWEYTEKVLEDIAKEMKLDYSKELGEAAFYGPKLDFKVKDCLGRERQCSTLQFDFNLPERFDMTFTNNKGEDERPYMLHRALLGSFERFIGVLIEHYAGAFPFRLSPEQIRIIPVAEKFIAYADKIHEKFHEQFLRSTVDDSDDSFSKKIRNAEIEKIPYIVIVGEKEESTKTLSIREYRSKKQYETGVAEFVDKCLVEVKTRKL
ncbi:MAG: threonine--tRNA ligase [Candidatus Absconditabacterales bacterium]